VAALAWLAVGTGRVFPNHLAYFNEAAGGPEGGYRYLVDSNLDWGQSFIQLRQWLESHHNTANIPVYLSYYTYTDPSLYEIRYQPIAPSPGAPPVLPSRFNPSPGVYTIGATTLKGVMLADPDTFSWFRQRQPIARPGAAIFVYEVKKPSALPTWLAQCTQPAPPLEPQVITEGLGRNDLRLAYFDCTQSWLLPANGQSPGWYALHHLALTTGDHFIQTWLGRTKLSYEQRTDRDSPAFAIYEQSSASPEPACTAESVALDGPLSFRGYTVSGSSVRPGDTMEVETCWQVTMLPQRPLSIMLHLVGPEGKPRLVADGLGVPIEQWQVGDVVVQRHRLAIPLDTPPGNYQLVTGAYWLDTLERWTASDGTDTVTLSQVHVESSAKRR